MIITRINGDIRQSIFSVNLYINFFVAKDLENFYYFFIFNDLYLKNNQINFNMKENNLFGAIIILFFFNSMIFAQKPTFQGFNEQKNLFFIDKNETNSSCLNVTIKNFDPKITIIQLDANVSIVKSLRSTTSLCGQQTTFQVSQKYSVQQCIGQESVIGNFTENNFILFQGFVMPLFVFENIQTISPQQLKAKIFPNPFNSQITIQIEDEIKQFLSIKIYNSQSQLVFSQTFNENQKDLSFNFDNLFSGVNIIVLRSE